MSSELQQLVIDGQTIWVEVDSTVRPAHVSRQSQDAGRTVTTSTSGAALATLVTALSQADITQTLAALITPVHAALAQVRPEEVSVELSLGFKGEVGIFVAKSEANAAIKITAKWKFGQADAKAEAPAPAQDQQDHAV